MQQPPDHHLAELNIGRILYDLEDPRMAEFAGNLALVNGIAERSEGFVWRYVDDDGSGDATDTRPFDDPKIIVNLSVWHSVADLERFVWQTVHKRFYGRRAEWFAHFDGPAVALWWVPAGHRPSVDVLFESVAKVVGPKAVGAILTGMGRDGASGLRLMREAGCYTVGQSQSSALVYGMPRVAFEEGAVVEQAPLEVIAARLAAALARLGAPA